MKRLLTTSVTSGIIHTAMRVDLKLGTSQRLVLVRETSPISMWNVEFNTADIVINGDTSATVLTNYTAGTWYKVAINFDTAVPTAKARVDGGAWSSGVASVASRTGDITEVRFEQGDTGLGPQYYDQVCEGVEPTAQGCAVAAAAAFFGDFFFFFFWGMGIRPRKLYEQFA